MPKKILILSLGLVVLIAGITVGCMHSIKKEPRAMHKAASTARCVLKDSAIGGIPNGTLSSANYKLITGVLNLAPENEEVHSNETH